MRPPDDVLMGEVREEKLRMTLAFLAWASCSGLHSLNVRCQLAVWMSGHSCACVYRSGQRSRLERSFGSQQREARQWSADCLPEMVPESPLSSRWLWESIRWDANISSPSPMRTWKEKPQKWRERADTEIANVRPQKAWRSSQRGQRKMRSQVNKVSQEVMRTNNTLPGVVTVSIFGTWWEW